MRVDVRGHLRDPTGAVLVLMVLVCSAVVWLARANASGPVRPAVVTADAPDPSLSADGGVFYLYSTNSVRNGVFLNVPVSTSPDLTSWTDGGDALPTLGRWAEPGWTWAPSARRFTATFQPWVLYYTARDRASGRQCIGVAAAKAAAGPYVDRFRGPIVCQLDRGGSIDPESFVDADGSSWLVWKSDDNAIGGRSVLWSQRLSPDGQSLVGSPTALLVQDQLWEFPVIEAPSLVRANGQLFLFYSGQSWDSASYAIGYARCSSPAGPCTKITTGAPWLSQSNSAAVGPGGESLFVTPGGATVMAFHAWAGAVGYENGGRRVARIEPVDFSAGAPDWRPDLPRLHRQFLRDSVSAGVADRTSVLDAPNGGRLLACDWDGDGVATPGTFVNGTWYVTNAPTGTPQSVFGYGDPGDIPVCGDWDGDGRQTPGVVRNGVWYLSNVLGAPTASTVFGYGDRGDVPVVGDWDGDGRQTPGVVRNGVWYLSNVLGAPTASTVFGYGNPTDLPVVGDWDGDHAQTPGVLRDGTWYLSDSLGAPVADRVFAYGDPGDLPLSGRWSTDDATIGIGVAR